MTTYRCTVGIRIYCGAIYNAPAHTDLVRVERVDWAPQVGMHMLFPGEEDDVAIIHDALQIARVVAILQVGRPQAFDVQLCPLTPSPDNYRAMLQHFRDRLWTVAE